MASHTQNERYLRDGAVLIYQRTDVAKPLWHCRIKFADHPYIRKSLKTQNEQAAVRAASKLYDDLRFRHQRGMPITSYSFEYALDAYLQWLEDQGNTETDEDKARRLKKKLVDQRKFSRYIREFFADRPLDQITSAEVEQYKDWRRTYWTSGPGSKLKFIEYVRDGKKVRQKKPPAR